MYFLHLLKVTLQHLLNFTSYHRDHSLIWRTKAFLNIWSWIWSLLTVHLENVSYCWWVLNFAFSTKMNDLYGDICNTHSAQRWMISMEMLSHGCNMQSMFSQQGHTGERDHLNYKEHTLQLYIVLLKVNVWLIFIIKDKLACCAHHF